MSAHIWVKVTEPRHYKTLGTWESSCTVCPWAVVTLTEQDCKAQAAFHDERKCSPVKKARDTHPPKGVSVASSTDTRTQGSKA